MKATAIIEDFTALGTISSIAALDILHGMGITTAALPTMMLSTSSEGFGTPQRLIPSNWQNATTNHWRSLDQLQLSAVMVGYLGTSSLIERVIKLVKSSGHVYPLLIDPVMADGGKLYDGFTAEYPAKMLELVRLASVITPNPTELQLLAEIDPIDLSPTSDQLGKVVNVLRQEGVKGTIVVTGVRQQERLGALVFLADKKTHQPLFYGASQYPGHFFGTGDTFSALLCGYLVHGVPIAEAVQIAIKGVEICVAETAQLPVKDRIYGMKMRSLLKFLTGQSV